MIEIGNNLTTVLLVLTILLGIAAIRWAGRR